MMEINKTVVVGSTEHRKMQADQIDKHMQKAIDAISYEGTFTLDQLVALDLAILSIKKAIKAAR